MIKNTTSDEEMFNALFNALIQSEVPLRTAGLPCYTDLDLIACALCFPNVINIAIISLHTVNRVSVVEGS